MCELKNGSADSQMVGVDTSKPPSMMQMMKLSMDKDMREAGQNVSAV